MFFNRTKDDDNLQLSDSEMTPGMKETIDEIVSGWGEVQRGLHDARLVTDAAPVKITRKPDVDYLLTALDGEAKRIEAQMDRAIADRKRQHQAEIAQKDAQIAAINREIEAIETKVRSQGEDIHHRAEALINARDTAKKIYPAFDGKEFCSAFDVRREVVRRSFGDAAVAGKSEAYIDDRFELLAARVNVDPFAVVVSEGIRTNDAKSECDRAYNEMVQRLRDSHKDPTKH
jgi:hypothetical protein